MKPRFAICIDNSQYPASLEVHKVYRVLPDEDAERDGDLRIIDESGEDYLYPAEYFILINVPQEAEPALINSFAGTANRATSGCIPELSASQQHDAVGVRALRLILHAPDMRRLGEPLVVYYYCLGNERQTLHSLENHFL